METSQEVVRISNFKLNVFSALLKQSLIVTNQLTLEFTPEIIKSCSFSMTKSLIKIWSIPLNSLLNSQSSDELEILDAPVKEPKKMVFPSFDFYVLKGDLFHGYLAVHNSDTVDLEFTLNKINGKYQASEIKIIGQSTTNFPLTTTFSLTTEELITNKVEDYSLILSECTPTKEMIEFVLEDSQIREIKRLIKSLHKSVSNNTSFLTFVIDGIKNNVSVKDKVFVVNFPLNVMKNSEAIKGKVITFNILKSDFGMFGNHTFSIFTDESTIKVIFGGNFANSVIWCLTSKVTENTISLQDNDDIEQSISDLDIAEYL